MAEAKTRATTEPTLSAKLITQEIMTSAEQEFLGMNWNILDTNIIYPKCLCKEFR